MVSTIPTRSKSITGEILELDVDNVSVISIDLFAGRLVVCCNSLTLDAIILGSGKYVFSFKLIGVDSVSKKEVSLPSTLVPVIPFKDALIEVPGNAIV